LETPHTVWQEQDADTVVPWHPATPPRLVEGPLPLSLFAGRTLALALDPGQVACRTRAGQVVQTWLDGQAPIAVGATEEADADDRLWFVRTATALSWRWRQDARLVVAVGSGRTVVLPVRGACSVVIADPVRLVRELLAGLEHLDPEVLQDVVATHVRAGLEARLRPLAEDGQLDPVRAQVLLEGLTCEQLDDDLGTLGLACQHVAATLAPDPVATVAPATTVPPGSYDDLL
jgi:hypothetical protein